MAKNKKQAKPAEVALPVGVGGIIMIVASIILLCAAISYAPSDLPLTPMKFLKDFAPSVDPILPRKNIFGPLGAFLGLVQLQLLGASTFMLVAGVFIFGVKRLLFKERESIWMRVGLFCGVACAAGLLSCQDAWLSDWAGQNFLASPGGIIGQLLGEYFLENLIATVGATIVFTLGYITSLIVFCGMHPLEFISGLADMISDGFSKASQNIADRRRARPAKPKKEKPSRIPPLSTSIAEEEPAPKRQRKLPPVTTIEETEEPPIEESPAPEPEAPAEPPPPVAVPPVTEEIAVEEPAPLATPPQIIDGTAKKIMSQEQMSVKPFEKKERTGYEGLTGDGFENYELPGFDLLDYDASAPPPETNHDELLKMQRTIVDTLKSFGVDVTPGDITRGPTITRFEVYPSLGLKVSRITALEADLARVTKAESINILAPIPGKDTVGIEVANKNRILVPFSEILLDDKFRSSKRKIPLALGKNVYGEAVIGDLAAMPHCLVAGATGAGKSVCINTIICSILYKFGPDELRFIMVDPKVVEMQVYSNLPHLVVPVITDPQKVVGALKWCVNEMERRYKLFAKCKVRNFDGFNNRERPEKEAPAPQDEPLPEDIDEEVDMEQIESIARAFEDGELGPEAEVDPDLAGFPEEADEDEIPDRLPYIVIIIDELADLMQTAPADVELCIARIAQKARAAGMHLIVATQTPRADVVTGIIKANIPSRISFQVSSKIDSRVILDTGGAEKLVGKGDMLFLPPGSAKLERSQGAFVSDEEVDQIVEFCANQADQQFEEAIQNSIDAGGEDSDGGDDDVSSADEELLQKCLEVIVQEQKASTSLLQRRLRLGYTRAARIIDIMEQRGYIGPADGARPREVFYGN